MDFAFSDEQEMIREAAAAFLSETSTSDAIRRAMLSEPGYDRDLWRRIATELCWPAVHIDEHCGGMGLGYVELVALQEQMGRYLLCSPFFSTVCMAVNALLLAGNRQQQAQYLNGVVQGQTMTLAFGGTAAARRGGQWGPEIVELIAQPDGDGYRLTGTQHYVVDGASAETLIVAARLPNTAGEKGISIFLVPANTAGLTRETLATMDQTRRQARVHYDNVQVAAENLLGTAGEGWSALRTTLDLAAIALAAEQVGGAQQMLGMTVAYTLEREQFNRPIASFQAVKHRAADMMTRLEVARSGVYYAACIAQEALAAGPLAGELSEAASIAKSTASEAFLLNSADALQLHGGVGFTWEYDVHLYFKRAKAGEHLLGSPVWHRERLANLLLDHEQAATS